jgi:threonyl-tRNA synthetase
MIHRVILGSLERFIATLIEHYAGKFPLWLAPVQICVLNISEDLKDYAGEVMQELESRDFRVEDDFRDETLQKRIRDKELAKIPYLVIVGKKEKASRQISVRKRGGKNLGVMKIDDFIELLKDECR